MSWFDSILDTTKGLIDTAAGAFVSYNQTKAQEVQLQTESAAQAQATADSVFWKRFAVAGLVSVLAFVGLKAFKIIR